VLGGSLASGQRLAGEEVLTPHMLLGRLFQLSARVSQKIVLILPEPDICGHLWSNRGHVPWRRSAVREEGQEEQVRKVDCAPGK